jgi:hypothetical protein
MALMKLTPFYHMSRLTSTIARYLRTKPREVNMLLRHGIREKLSDAVGESIVQRLAI